MRERAVETSPELTKRRRLPWWLYALPVTAALVVVVGGLAAVIQFAGLEAPTPSPDVYPTLAELQFWLETWEALRTVVVAATVVGIAIGAALVWTVPDAVGAVREWWRT